MRPILQLHGVYLLERERIEHLAQDDYSLYMFMRPPAVQTSLLRRRRWWIERLASSPRPSSMASSSNSAASPAASSPDILPPPAKAARKAGGSDGKSAVDEQAAFLEHGAALVEIAIHDAAAVAEDEKKKKTCRTCGKQVPKDDGSHSPDCSCCKNAWKNIVKAGTHQGCVARVVDMKEHPTARRECAIRFKRHVSQGLPAVQFDVMTNYLNLIPPKGYMAESVDNIYSINQDDQRVHLATRARWTGVRPNLLELRYALGFDDRDGNRIPP